MLLGFEGEGVHGQRIGLLDAAITGVVLPHLSSGEVIEVLRGEAFVTVQLETDSASTPVPLRNISQVRIASHVSAKSGVSRDGSIRSTEASIWVGQKMPKSLTLT